MAEYLIAYKKTIRNEIGWVKDPNDHGGETWDGISRVFWPHWIGWDIIDHYKQLPGFPGNLRASQELQKAKQDFYRVNFWNPIRGDEIKSQDIANDFFDMAVNMGTGAAVGIEDEAQGLAKATHVSDALLDHLNNVNKIV